MNYLLNDQTFATSKHQNYTLGSLFVLFNLLRETVNSSRLEIVLYLVPFSRSTAGHTLVPNGCLVD